MPDLDTWRTINLGIAALGQTAFVLLYLTFPWYKTFLGRALFFKAVTLGVLVDFVWIARYYKFGYFDILFVWMYGVLAVAIWFQFLAFLRVKREGRENQ